MLLTSENERLDKLKISGMFIELTPFGEAIIVSDLHGDLKSLVYTLDDSNFLRKVRSRGDFF
jgi:hypothetical protein